MTTQEILNILQADGIELAADNANLRVRSTKAKITDIQRALIAENKAALLDYLTTAPDERICGSRVQTDADVTSALSAPNQTPPSDPNVFKEYTLPNGEKLQVTREEFDRVVDVFRQLMDQDTKLKRNHGVAS